MISFLRQFLQSLTIDKRTDEIDKQKKGGSGADSAGEGRESTWLRDRCFGLQQSVNKFEADYKDNLDCSIIEDVKVMGQLLEILKVHVIKEFEACTFPHVLILRALAMSIALIINSCLAVDLTETNHDAILYVQIIKTLRGQLVEKSNNISE